MEKRYSKRTSPLAKFAVLAMVLLVLLEAVMVSGVLVVKAQTVAKYAPWAYESFLKLVGEHPDSPARWAVVEEEEKKSKKNASVLDAPIDVTGGLLADVPPVTIDTNPAPETATPAEPAPTNPPPAKVEEVVPVG